MRKPIPKRKNETAYISIPRELMSVVRRRAAVERRDIKNMLRVLIENGLREPSPLQEAK